MREILFRGKQINNGEWVEGFYSPIACNNGTKPSIIVGTERNCFIPEFVDPLTIGQFTGLTDKNGKKIFEGDMVRNGYSSNLGEFWDIGNVVYVSTDGCFEICNLGEPYLKRLTQTQIVKRSIEVVGTVYDNT